MADSNKNTNNKKSKVVNKRASSLKMFSITSTLIALAIVLVLNILLSLTVDGYLTLDLSPTSKNSVSEQTLDYISSLPDGTLIKIVGLFDKPSSVTDTPFEYIIPMLEDLEARSGGKVAVSYVNPDKYPSIISELDPKGVSTLEKDMFAVSCDGKVRVIDPYSDCFSYNQDEYTGLNYPNANRSESAFINTIISLTSKSSYKVYYLTGIQEAPHTYLDSIFASMNIETAELPSTEPFVVPDDCSLLIINNPDIDISESVQEGIKSYIKNGNRPVNILVSVGITKNNINNDFPHLNNVLNEVNLAVDNKCIMEENPEYIVSPDISVFRGDLTADYMDLNAGGSVVYQLSRPVIEMSRASSSIGSKPIIIASSNNNLYDMVNVNEDGSEISIPTSYANVAAAGFYVGTTNPVNVIVFGSAYFTTDTALNQFSGSNAYNVQTIRNLIGKMFTTETNIDIPAKGMLDYSIDVTRVNANNLSVISVVFIAVIPFVFVIIAAIVYHKRSHL